MPAITSTKVHARFWLQMHYYLHTANPDWRQYYTKRWEYSA